MDASASLIALRHAQLRAQLRIAQKDDVRMTYTTAEGWAGVINREREKTVHCIITQGQLCQQAKKALDHGEWLRMFADGLVAIKEDTAERLMKIASHAIISNSAHARNLPASRESLYELTKWPDNLLHTHLLDHSIHPEVKRSELRQIRKAAATAAAAVVPVVRKAGAVKGQTLADRQQRLAQMQELAAEGHTSEQIAEAVSLSPATCRSLLKAAAIPIPADAVVRGSHRLNPNRILDHLVQTLADMADDERLIDFRALDPDRIPDWIASLLQSRRTLNRLIHHLQVRKDSHHHATEANPQAIENPTSADQSDDRATGTD